MKSRLFRPRAAILTLVAFSLVGAATYSIGYSRGKTSVLPADGQGYTYGTWERQGNDPNQGYNVTLNNQTGKGFEYLQFGSNGVLEEHRMQLSDQTSLKNFSGSKSGWDSSRVIDGLNTREPTTVEIEYLNGAQVSEVTGHLVSYNPKSTDHGFYMGVSQWKYRINHGKLSHKAIATGDWVYDPAVKVAYQAPTRFSKASISAIARIR